MTSIWLSLLISLLITVCGPFKDTSDSKAITFKQHTLTTDFISEGVAVGDVNNDGKTDILAGSYWFEAPDWTPHALDTPRTFSPGEEYSHSFLNFATDVNGDGWIDFIRIDTPGEGVYWYENPKNQGDGYWQSHLIHGSVCNESPRFEDVDGDGQKDLLFSDEHQGKIAWFSLSREDGEVRWQSFPVSKPQAPGTERYSHGLGVGDINGDGRNDVMVREGWWEAPSDPRSGEWTFHPADLGAPCAQMYVYDFDQDGDQDIISSSAHDYGIWWHEQDGDSWKEHLIFNELSQSHGLAFTDMNGDGLPDLVTGKRYFAHMGKDPGAHEPAMLYWFEYQLKEGKPVWTPHEVDDNSGVGLQVIAEDISGDGLPDIIAANKKGVFYFEQVRSK